MINLLKERFENNMHRHEGVSWDDVEAKLTEELLGIVSKMEKTGGEPDVFKLNGQLVYVDFCKESPSYRRALTYDFKGESARIKKGIHPKGNVMDMAKEIGIKVLDEFEYQLLQNVEDLDLKTSSWLLTNDVFREKGGALFGEKRFGRTFIYANGAQSFYSARGFRGYVLIA